MKTDDVVNKLKDKGLKITPQRVAILRAIISMENHPSAEQVIAQIRKTHPNIATGTVYKVLDVLEGNGIIERVKTDDDIMRYDAVLDNHHHLYCIKTNRIENYFDDRLNNILEDYFKKKGIDNFKIDSIKLQINGRFTDDNN